MAVRYTLVPEVDPRNDVLGSIGKRYRKKAEQLLSYINDVKRTENDRIIYGDGEVGSHLVDLIKYFVYPEFLKLKRPQDAVKFALLLKEKDIPPSILGRQLSLTNNVQWKRL
jgi:hypothetical protein